MIVYKEICGLWKPTSLPSQPNRSWMTPFFKGQMWILLLKLAIWKSIWITWMLSKISPGIIRRWKMQKINAVWRFRIGQLPTVLVSLRFVGSFECDFTSFSVHWMTCVLRRNVWSFLACRRVQDLDSCFEFVIGPIKFLSGRSALIFHSFFWLVRKSVVDHIKDEMVMVCKSSRLRVWRNVFLWHWVHETSVLLSVHNEKSCRRPGKTEPVDDNRCSRTLVLFDTLRYIKSCSV